jgi:alkylation response protein AidB-like acyl-CoA dehydrogenase
MTETLSLLSRDVEDFAREHLLPREPQLEAAGAHSDTAMAPLLGKQGWFGLHVAAEHGGMDAPHAQRCSVLAGLARPSAATAAILQASLIPATAIRYWGTDEQRRRWLPPIAAGTLYPAIMVTEPDAGGTVLEITAAARLTGGDWLLDGEKVHIGNGAIAGLMVVVARTGKPGVRDTDGLSAFLVPAAAPGVEVLPAPLDGLRGFTADTVRLRGVRVPKHSLLGEVGDGAAVAHMASMVVGRLNFAAMATGMLRRVLAETIAALSQRRRARGRLLDHPDVQPRVTEIQSHLLTAEAVTHHAAGLLDSGAGCDAELCHAKLAAVAAARAGIEVAIDLAGGVVNRPDHVVNRLRADIQCLVHPAGPPDFQRHRIRQSVLNPPVQWSQTYTSRFPTLAPALPPQGHRVPAADARRLPNDAKTRRERQVEA